MLDRECDPKFGGSPSPSCLKTPAIFITSSVSPGSRFSSLIYCETVSKIGSLTPDKKLRIKQNESLFDIRNILYFFTLIADAASEPEASEQVSSCNSYWAH